MRGLERVMAADNNTDTNVASISVVGMKRPASPTDHLEREQHMNDANIKRQHTLWKSEEEFKNQEIIRALVENSIGNILARNGEGKDEKKDEHAIGIAPNVKEGSRVEIRWVIENTLSDEENISNETKRIKEEVVWWGATVTKRGEDNTTTNSKNVCDVMYDARTEDFPAEAAKIVLLSEHECCDVNDPSMKFCWRKEGDSTFFVVGEGEDDEDEDLTMQDVIEYQTKIDGDTGDGDTLADASEKAFGTLPMDQQLRVATGFAQMKGKLMEKLREISEKNGAGYTVTKDDMDRIMLGLRNESS